MKTLVAILIALTVSNIAFGKTNHLGGAYIPYGYSGSSGGSYGAPQAPAYYKPSTTYQQVGSHTYGSDGSSAQQIGNTTYMNSGYGKPTTTCTKVGESTMCY